MGTAIYFIESLNSVTVVYKTAYVRRRTLAKGARGVASGGLSTEPLKFCILKPKKATKVVGRVPD
jgi:hypothetical protein